MPQKNNKPVVYDEYIKKWYIGDRTIINEIPSIVIYGKQTQIKKISMGMYELTWEITISGWNQATDREKSERKISELSRLIFECLLPHRILYVNYICPICSKKFLSPLHYSLSHPSIMSTYLTAAQSNLDSIWNNNHLVSTSPPTWTSSGLAVEAFNLLYTDIVSNINTYGVSGSLSYSPNNGIGSTANNNFNTMYSNKVRPIRLLYNVELSGITPIIQENEKQFLSGGEFTLKANELIPITAFGPDNISTSAYTWTSE